MSLKLRGRSRRPKQKRERKQTIPQLILPEGARAIRHALHTVHHIEHFAERQHELAIEQATGPLTITITATVNAEDLEDVDDQTLAEIEDDIHDLLEDVAANAVEESKSLAPVNTGLLRETIDATVDDNALMITLSADTDYAQFQEYGTSKMRPHPFLNPVVANAQVQLDTGIDAIIASHLDQKLSPSSPNDNSVDLDLEGNTVEGGDAFFTVLASEGAMG